MAAQKMNLGAKVSRPIPDEISLETMARNGGSHLNRHQVRAVVERELERFVLAQKGAKGFHQQTSRAAAAAMQQVLDILDGKAVSLPAECGGAAAIEELKRDVA
jgi:hypothetical protein